MTQVTWQRGSVLLSRLCKQLHPAFFPQKLRIWLRSLAIYKPTPLPATPTPLCKFNLIFHTNAPIRNGTYSQRASVDSYC
jgi:hypothetical protein